jgi:predicted nucleic acid-binding protein
MAFYLDASVILPALITERSSAAVEAFLRAQHGALCVSPFAAAEVASALSRMARTGERSVADALALLADFDTWRAVATHNIDLQSVDVRLADIFVRRFDLKLRTPDALHAAICRRTGDRLVTLDNRLADAARELGIDVVVPAPQAGVGLA